MHFEIDVKELALAKFLEIDPGKIKEDYENCYLINPRIVKRGRTPAEFRELANDFRKLLSEDMAELATEAIISPERKKTVTDEKGMKYVPLHKYAYDIISEFLKTMKADAEKRAEEMRRLGIDDWEDPFEDNPLDIYAKLEKENSYVENVLYWLVSEVDGSEKSNSNSLRRAWLGQKLEDVRENVHKNDGEYLVLTDEEADEAEREWLEQYMEEFIVPPSDVDKYFDREKWLEDHSGARGETLAGWDSVEEQVDFEGVTYFIYRTN